MNNFPHEIRKYIFSFVYPLKIKKGDLIQIKDNLYIDKAIFIKYIPIYNSVLCIPIKYFDSSNTNQLKICYYIYPNNFDIKVLSNSIKNKNQYIKTITQILDI